MVHFRRALSGLLLAACASAGGMERTAVRPDVVPQACVDSAFSLPDELAAALPPRTGRMSPDDQWADLAERTPGGFAGVLYDESGRPVLMLTRPHETAAAKAALAPALSGFPVREAEVRQARWDFAQLVNWYNYLTHTADVFGHGRLISGDKDERLNRIVFGMTDSSAIRHTERELAKLGVPCELVVLRIAAPVEIRR